MIATNLQAELSSYVDAGLTPFQALQTATVNSAKSLNLDAGTLEAGKLADITLLEGDPRENIANTFNVRKVIANGQYYDVAELIAAGQENGKYASNKDMEDFPLRIVQIGRESRRERECQYG